MSEVIVSEPGSNCHELQPAAYCRQRTLPSAPTAKTSISPAAPEAIAGPHMNARPPTPGAQRATVPAVPPVPAVPVVPAVAPPRPPALEPPAPAPPVAPAVPPPRPPAAVPAVPVPPRPPIAVPAVPLPPRPPVAAPPVPAPPVVVPPVPAAPLVMPPVPALPAVMPPVPPHRYHAAHPRLAGLAGGPIAASSGRAASAYASLAAAPRCTSARRIEHAPIGSTDQPRIARSVAVTRAALLPRGAHLPPPPPEPPQPPAP